MRTGELDRITLSKLIFSNKEAKEKIDQLTTKFIVPKILGYVKEFANLDVKVVIDAPLLFEMGLNRICDITIGMLANEKLCISRICARDAISEENAKARLESQKSNEYFKINCDYVINNHGGKAAIDEALEDIFNGKNLSNRNVIQVKAGDIEYLQFRKLLNYSDKITHCYTMKPLDFRLDNPKEVIRDYKAICDTLGIDSRNICRPRQTHSREIAVVEEAIGINNIENVDGLVTDVPDKILSLVFADCTALYFYDPEKNVIRKYPFRLERNFPRNCKKSSKRFKRRIWCRY